MDIQTILAIAEKHNNPDAEIQYRAIRIPHSGSWADTGGFCIYDMIKSVNGDAYEYRIKPNTVTLNGEELPRPVKPTRVHKAKSFVNSHTEGEFFVDGVQCYMFETEQDAEKWVSALNKLFNS